MSLRLDLSYLRRSLVRSPGPALAVWAGTVVWLALAPAVLSLLYALEWRSLPFANPERVVWVSAGYDLVPDLAASGRFQAIAAMESGWLVAEGPRGAETVVGAAVDPAFFQALGIQPLQGRVFSTSPGPSESGGAVVTARLWRRLFGDAGPWRPASFRVGSHAFEVLGIVPDRPVFPEGAELWIPRTSGVWPDSSFPPPELTRAGILGRLAEGTSAQAAEAAVQTVAHEFEQREKRLQGDVEALPLDRLLRRTSRGEKKLLAACLGGLLAFLVLAYASTLAGFLAERRQELALRMALGARRQEWLRLLLLYFALLAIPGFLAGLPLAFVTLGRLADLVPASLAALIPPRLDLLSLGLSLAGWALAVVLSITAVLLPALWKGRAALLGPAPSETRQSRPQALARLGLVCAALSLAVTLGLTTAVLRQSLLRLESQPLGFEPKGVVAGVIRFAAPPAPDRLPALLDRLAERLRRVPGTAKAGFSSAIPFAAPAGSFEITSLDRSRFWLARVQSVGGDFLGTMGLRLITGRAFQRPEEEAGAPVALLDEQGARKIYGDRSPLGGVLVLNDTPVRIVGVVSSVRTSLRGEDRQPRLYLPFRTRLGENGPTAVAALLLLSGPLRETDLESALAGSGATLSQLQPLSSAMDATLAPERLARDLAGLQWLACLGLVAFATFGTFSWLLEIRSLEFAIRLALGDSRRGIAARALRAALAVIGIAIVLGVALYLPAGQSFRALLFGVEVLSPRACVEAVAVVSGVAGLAAGLAAASVLRRLSLSRLRDSR